MLAAGQFEYNFGDSEFLMLFLVFMTLPYAASRRCSLPAASMPAPELALRPSIARAAARSCRQLTGLPILIVGDLMLDHFVFGRVNRISPEAPVPVVEFDREEFRVGGAGNVAHNVRELGGVVDVVGAHRPRRARRAGEGGAARRRHRHRRRRRRTRRGPRRERCEW